MTNNVWQPLQRFTNNVGVRYLCRDLIYLLRGIFWIMEGNTFISDDQLARIKIIAGWSRIAR